MTAITWLGDEDPDAQVITLYGHTFVKGEAVNVTDKDVLKKLEGNALFSSDKAAKAVEAHEPSDEERQELAEQGTVKAALRRELAERGVVLRGNPSEDTLRNKLAETTKPQANG